MRGRSRQDCSEEFGGREIGHPTAPLVDDWIKQECSHYTESDRALSRRADSHCVSAMLGKTGNRLRNHQFALGTAFATGLAQGGGDLRR